MKINGSEYKLPELNFNAMCRLEDMGISLYEMDKRVLSTVRGFLALAMDDDMERAGVEIENHLAGGGSIDVIMDEINKAVNESGFFRSQSEQERGESKEQERREIGKSTERIKDKKQYSSIKQIINDIYLPNAIIMGVDYNTF